MKFFTLVFIVLAAIILVDPINCSNDSPNTPKTIEAEVSSALIEANTENVSLAEMIGSSAPAENVTPKACTCAKEDKDQNVVAAPAVQGDQSESRVAPQKESKKSTKKTSSKKYRVITITLPEESEGESVEIVGDLGQALPAETVSSFIKDEAELTRDAEEEEKKADAETKKAEGEDTEQQQERSSDKKSQKEDKNKGGERGKKSGKYDSKRSKRDTKGGSKGGQHKNKSHSKNKKSGGKNRK